MPDAIPMSSADLRRAMRDPRYWQPGHPEQAAYGAWVSEGWRQVSAGEATGEGMVWVAPYTRHRDGEAEEVSGHYRSTRHAAAPDAARSRLRAAEADLPDGGRRLTLRDADGSLIGRCDSLADGSQVCTLGLPDGRVVVQELAAREGEIVPVGGPLAVPLVGGGALMTAAISLYNYLLNTPRPPRGGLDVADTPFLWLNRGFEGTEAGLRVVVGTLSPERVLEFCPKTPEFEELLAGVARATPREGMSAQQWGTAVHTEMRNELRLRYPSEAASVRAEFSLMGGTPEPRSIRGTSRLDIFHHVEGTSTICVYDIKTGRAGLDDRQAWRIYREAHSFATNRGVATPHVVIVELRPRQ
jgi:hypothetical protein